MRRVLGLFVALAVTGAVAQQPAAGVGTFSDREGSILSERWE